ncbi:adenosylcobinamide-phosphate synthase CbiB [Sneathiella chinensis]|uniref:Cobalamin biosynthesis protein CobD n=1 Tax=Sneathiella chinensis TaxID=349750 RepID=A0ABQ5U2W9_9PROT|nr:adenosylcobinamide-phosphate synthase CbiB [Sneathiella chinensis]GLQ06173.1 cobalamin biosynthesis protein CobD [Sneathiella chinensis]
MRGRQNAVDLERGWLHFGGMLFDVQVLLGRLSDPATLAVAVFALDCLIGDPAALYRRIWHPVVVIGKLISLFEQALNRPVWSNPARFTAGLVTTCCVVSLAFWVGMGAVQVTHWLPETIVLLVLFASSLVAWRGLQDGVARVEADLRLSLQDGRVAVSHIVGRDPASLDESGVSRAAIESLSENFSDGTTAPLFWFLLLGLPGLLAYKAVNTLDSMIGHRSDRYEYFGKAAARLDDVVNFVPARLTGFLIVLAAWVTPGAHGSAALRGLFRDAAHHKSINAGWQEAAMAGALGVALAGPRQYGGTLVDDVWMNPEGCKTASADDIRLALKIYRMCGILLFILLAGIALVHLLT